MTTEEKLVDAERRLREISKIVYTPTPGSMKAHVHFQRDFDAIRKLTSPWYEAKEPPK